MCVFARHSHGCFYHSKKGAVEHIKQYLITEGHDLHVGISRVEMQSVLDGAPHAIKWAIQKVGAVEGVLLDCDANGDGVVTIEEVDTTGTCLDSCWKQFAIGFLP